MSKLITDNHFSDADGFYAALTEVHRELSSEDTERLNARLILLLANHIGDKQVLLEALDIAAQLEQ